MPFGKGNWHGIRQALRADPYLLPLFVKYMTCIVSAADVRGSTMLRTCPWESRHCMYVPFRSKCPWELMCWLLLGHICTDPFLDLGDNSCEHSYKKTCPLFQGYFSESSRQNLSRRTPLNQQCMNVLQTETGGLQVREKKLFMIDLLSCKNYICSVWGNCLHSELFFKLSWVIMSHWNSDLWKKLNLIPFSDWKVWGYHRKEHSTLTEFSML